MARHTVNREGMTFEEWVCAAGLAVTDGSLVLPYSESWTQQDSRRTFSGYVYEGPKVRVRRVDVYGRKVRRAWLDGEDPTEYRA
jgi:hypothetical protein